MAGGSGWTRSPFVGVLIGVFAGGLVILLVEALGHALFGTASPGSDDVTGVMFVSVLVAWIVGSATAGALATYWARASSVWPGLIAALVLVGGAVANFFAFPHPVWMIAASLVLMPLAAVGAASRVRQAAV